MTTSIGFDIFARDRASKTFANVGNEAEKGTSKLHSFGKIAAGVFAGGALFEGAQKAAEFLKGSVEAAVQDQQANAVLARQLKNTTGATDAQVKAAEEWVTKTAEASGVAKSDLTPTLTKLATVTGSVTKAQKLTTLAMNVSAGTHKSLTSITDALVRAQNGSVGGLSRLGIATKNADGSTKSFKQVQAELAKQFKGDSAAAADTAAGKMKRLGVTWEEMKVQIGDKLLPVLTTLATFMLDDVLPAIGKVAGILHGQFVKGILDAQGPVRQFSAVIRSKWGGIVTWAKQNFGQLVADIKLYLALLLTEVKIDLKVIEFIWKHWGKDITAVVVAVFKVIGAVIGGALKIIGGILKVAMSLIHGNWKGAWQGIKQILAGVWQIIKALVTNGFAILKALFKAGGTALKLLMQATWTAIKFLVKAGATGLVDLIKGIPGDIRGLAGLYLSAGKFLIQALFRGIVAAAKAGTGFAADLLSAVKNAINSSLHLPLQINFDKGPIHIHATVIPALARGTSYFPGGLALVGEQGPEIVSMARGARVYPHGKGPGQGGGDTIINVYASGLVDPQAIVGLIETELVKRKRVRGSLAFQ